MLFETATLLFKTATLKICYGYILFETGSSLLQTATLKMCYGYILLKAATSLFNGATMEICYGYILLQTATPLLALAVLSAGWFISYFVSFVVQICRSRGYTNFSLPFALNSRITEKLRVFAPSCLIVLAFVFLCSLCLPAAQQKTPSFPTGFLLN